MKTALDNFFDLSGLKTNVKREILAGFTTFISMAYILFVNPEILGASGMDKGAVFTATALASAIGCLLMGLLAKYPIATAPSLGINAFFAYSVCIGMVLSAIFGIATGNIQMPHAFVAPAPSMDQTFLVALSHLKDINTLQMWVVVITFLLVTFFDTAGTLIALAQQAGFLQNNKMPRVGKALMSDSTAMLFGSLFGTSPVGAYVESSAGIAVGGRSGLTAVTTGICFILGLFFSPLLTVATSQVTAPALIIVGVLMAQSMARITWTKLEIAIPAFLTVAGMPLTYSISDGLALGFIAYPITMIAARKGKEVPALMYVLFFVFVIFFWVLNIEK